MDITKIVDAVKAMNSLSPAEKKVALLTISIAEQEKAMHRPKKAAKKIVGSKASKRGTFNCEHCDKVFSNLRGLGIHRSRAHDGKKIPQSSK